MHSLNDPRKSVGPGTRRVIQITGGGLVAGLVFVAAAGWLSSCAPGVLDCDQITCPQGGTGGGTGGGGGGGGTSPGKTAVPDCPTAIGGTVDDVEKFITMTCANADGCHKSNSVFKPDLQKTPIYMNLVDKAPTTYCMTNKLIDKSDSTKSFVLSKVQDAMPKCPGTTTAAGAQMPSMLPPLTADQQKCLKSYAMIVGGL